MNSSGNLIGAVVGILFFVFIAIPYAILSGLVWFITEYHEEILNFLHMTGKAVWKAHTGVGKGAVKLVRDVIVKAFFPEQVSDRTARIAIIIWLTLAPVLVTAIVWWTLAWLWSLVIRNIFISIILAWPSVVVIISGYYQAYSAPPNDYRLMPFIKEYHLMTLGIRLRGILRLTRLKIHWMVLSKSLRGRLLTNSKG